MASVWPPSSNSVIRNRFHPPHDGSNGVKFYSSQYLTPEEELIAWSKASESAPLNHWGQKRFEELFSEIFPQMAQSILG